MTRLHIFLFTVLIFAVTPATAEDTRYIAVASAYQGELDAVMEAIEGEEILNEKTINGVTFQVGRAYGKDVIFFRTNVNMTNAAMTTQFAISEFPVRALVFSGIAGGIDWDLKKGDIAIPAQWHYHATGAYFNPKSDESEGEGDHEAEHGENDDTEYLVPPGYEHWFDANFGMHHPRAVRAVRDGMEEPELIEFFPADESLLEIAERATKKLRMKNAQGKKAWIKIGGNGAAGPAFLDNAEYREFIYKTWQSSSIDMESTAVAHVCWTNHIPFIIVRGMSDLAGGQQGANEADEFAHLAEDNAARTLAAILKEMK